MDLESLMKSPTSHLKKLIIDENATDAAKFMVTVYSNRFAEIENVILTYSKRHSLTEIL